MQMLMMELGSQDARAYFVWVPILGPDNEEAARQGTLAYSAPNSVYFWVPTAKLSHEAAKVIGLAAGRPAWDVYLLYKRGMIWDRLFPAPVYWQQQLDVIQGDAFNPRAMKLRVLDALKPSRR